MIAGTPVILKITSKDVAAVAPRAARSPRADIGSVAEKEITFCAATVLTVESERAVQTVVARVEGVDALTPSLEPDVHGMGTLGPDNSVLILDDGVGKELIDVRRTDVADEFVVRECHERQEILRHSWYSDLRRQIWKPVACITV